MSKTFLLAVYVIIGSFVLSLIITPLSAMFNMETAVLIYSISWLALFVGLLLGGKCAYNHCTQKLKKIIKR